jgi:hypothetical protein
MPNPWNISIAAGPSAGDDHVAAQVADEPRNHAWPMHFEVWIGDDP